MPPGGARGNRLDPRRCLGRIHIDHALADLLRRRLLQGNGLHMGSQEGDLHVEGTGLLGLLGDDVLCDSAVDVSAVVPGVLDIEVAVDAAAVRLVEAVPVQLVGGQVGGTVPLGPSRRGRGLGVVEVAVAVDVLADVHRVVPGVLHPLTNERLAVVPLPHAVSAVGREVRVHSVVVRVAGRHHRGAGWAADRERGHHLREGRALVLKQLLHGWHHGEILDGLVVRLDHDEVGSGVDAGSRRLHPLGHGSSRCARRESSRQCHRYGADDEDAGSYCDRTTVSHAWRLVADRA